MTDSFLDTYQSLSHAGSEGNRGFDQRESLIPLPWDKIVGLSFCLCLSRAFILNPQAHEAQILVYSLCLPA